MRAAVEVLTSPILNCELVVLSSIKTGRLLNRYSRSIAETLVLCKPEKVHILSPLVL